MNRDDTDDIDAFDEFGELEPTEEELAEAEALARALERGVADAPPEDALEAAAVLRFSRDGGRLAPERGEAILETVLAEARPASPPQRAPLWRWLVPVSLAAVAAVVALTLRPPAARPLALPAPSEALLRAQAAAAAGDGRALDEAMASYRGEVLASLEGRYR